MTSIIKLVGSTLTDVEVNVNGFTVLYFENQKGEKYSVDLCPTVRTLEKATAPEVPVQEQFQEKNSKTINQLRSNYGLEPIENGYVTLHPIKLKVEITNSDEFKELISTTKENLQKIKDFKFEFKVTR